MLCVGCTGGGTGSQPSITSVAVSCSPTTVNFAGTSKCTSTVLGTGNYDPTVIWSASTGSIDQTGMFTAAKTTGSATIAATSKLDATKSGAASITLTTISGVTVSCTVASIHNNGTDNCSATVTGTGNFDQSVTWSTTSGTIDAIGKLTAPASGTSTTVTATSKMDSSETGSLTITLTAPTYTVQSGVAQKGPLIGGSQVSIQELDSSLNPTGKEYTFQTLSDLGNFSPSIEFGSNFLSAAASGYFFDENQNVVSDGPITIESYIDLSSDSVMNVNLLTTLAFQREQVLVQGGDTLDDAQKTAEKEVLAAFHIRNAEHFPNFGQLDLGKSGPQNAMLAALSSVFDYRQSAGTLSDFIASFQSDLADNGVIDTPSTLATVTASSTAINPTPVASNLNAKYSSASLNLTPTAITNWLDRDGDGVIGQLKFYQLNAKASTAYTSQPYIGGPDDDGTTFTTSAGTLFDNGTAVPSSGAVVHAGDSLTLQLTASPDPDVSTTAYMLSNGIPVARFKVTTTPIPIGFGGSLGGGIPYSVDVTPDGSTLLMTSFDTCSALNDCLTALTYDGGLYTFSLSTPTAPKRIGHNYKLYRVPDIGYHAEYSQVAYSSLTKTAFIADFEDNLQSFDVSNPSSPTFLSDVSIGCGPMSVALSSDEKSAFVGDGCGQIIQWNVSAPASMTLTKSILTNFPVGSLAQSPDGKQLLLFGGGKIGEVDLSSGTLGSLTDIDQNPSITGAPQHPFYAGTYIGNRMVVLLGKGGATIVDLTDPANPAIQGNVTFPPTTQPFYPSYAAYYSPSKGLVYLAANNNLYLLNASDPTSPYIGGTAALPAPIYASGVSISATPDGSTAYVVSGGQATVVSIQ